MIGEAGGGPDCGGAAIGSEEKGVGERRGVDVLEEAVEAIHQEINGELIAVGEIGGGGVVEQVGEGPLLFGAVAGIVDEQRAGVESGENLLGDGGGILAIGKNFNGLEGGREIRSGEFGGGAEIGADILIGDEERLLTGGVGGKAFFVVDDFGDDELGVGRGANG